MQKLIKTAMLLDGLNDNSPYRNAFYWQNQYSETDYTDNHNRWKRICYYNGFCIASITGHNKAQVKLLSDTQSNVDKKRESAVVDIFTLHCYFPNSSNEIGYTNFFNSLDEAKAYAEELFLEFVSMVAIRNNTAIMQHIDNRIEQLEKELEQFTNKKTDDGFASSILDVGRMLSALNELKGIQKFNNENIYSQSE